MTTTRRAAWVYWLPAVVWAGVIFVLSSQPWLPGPPGGLTDKHGHAVTYGLLALLVLFGWTRARWRLVTGSGAVLAATVATLYGASDEWHQSFVPGRTAEVGDLLADALGAAGAAGLGWAWAILLRRRDG